MNSLRRCLIAVGRVVETICLDCLGADIVGLSSVVVMVLSRAATTTK